MSARKSSAKASLQKEEPSVLKDSQGFVRRSYSGLEKLNKEYHTLLQPVLGKRGFSGVEIIESWIDIIGEDLALGIRPEKLKFEKGQRTNGVLYVKSAGGAFALLCEHHKEMILERVNTFFGYPAVRQIKILQGKLKFTPVPPPKEVFVPTREEKASIEEKVALIEDENLRKTLYETWLAFLESKRKKG